jgi:small-conductance mechanosensitive channel
VEGIIPGEGDDLSSAQDVATAVSERTPVPTPTPDAIDREVERLTTEAGLTGTSFLGLKIEDWINTLISGLLVFLGYLIFIKLMYIPKRIIRRIFPQADDEVISLNTRYLNYLLLVLLIRFSVLRLDWLGELYRTLVVDIFFLTLVGIAAAASLANIRYIAKVYERNLDPSVDRRRINPLIATVQRIAESLVITIGLSIVLSHFGLDISILAAILLVPAFILSFGAREVLSDIISGYIILVDQPFRAGDSILVKELDALGTVEEIGTRSTHIRTRDNRVVIIPNARIGQSQVVNYTFPDPKFRVQTEIGVAYGTDIETMRESIEAAVRSVDGVLQDKPVDIYYLKFGGSARLVRVRWWIDTYRDENIMLDRVNTALEIELDKVGIELPYDTYDLNVRMSDS